MGLVIDTQGQIYTLLAGLKTQLTNLEKIMAEDFTALNQSIADLKTEVGAIGTEMDTLFAQLMAAVQTGNQPAIDAAKAAIDEQIQALKDVGTRDQPPAPPAPPSP